MMADSVNEWSPSQRTDAVRLFEAMAPVKAAVANMNLRWLAINPSGLRNALVDRSDWQLYKISRREDTLVVSAYGQLIAEKACRIGLMGGLVYELSAVDSCYATFRSTPTALPSLPLESSASAEIKRAGRMACQFQKQLRTSSLRTLSTHNVAAYKES
jgi:hypothetical protein